MVFISEGGSEFSLIMKGTVAIITRTKNRPFLLKRAIESVLHQSYPNWIHVIVNDGGDVAAVDELMMRYNDHYKGRVHVIHNSTSHGMGAASNAGIKSVDSDYVVIHDDDDSWSPDFLIQAISALRYWSSRIPSVKGVVTHCNRVIEHIEGQIVITDHVEPFNHWMQPGLVSLDWMLHQNLFPPIAFLYERCVIHELGGYREDLPILEDWEFNVRFLMRYDIAVHPVALAFYHHRPSASGALGNNLFADPILHEQYLKLLLNQWLREDLSFGKFGIGSYVNLRQHIAFMSWKLEELDRRVATINHRSLFSIFWLWLRVPDKFQKVQKFFEYARKEGIIRTMQRVQDWASARGGF